MLWGEVWPQDRLKRHFCVSHVPKHKITQSLLSTRADKEIGIADGTEGVMGLQVLFEEGLGDVVDLDLPVLDVARDLLRGMDQILTPSVAQGQCENKTIIAPRFPLDGVDQLDHSG